MLSLMKSVAEKGGIADLICTSESLAQEAREFSRMVTIVPAWTSLRRFPRPSRVAEAFRLIRQSAPTVVHFNSVDAIVHALPVLGVLRIPSIAHIHIQGSAADLRYVGVHRVSRVVAVGAFGKRELLSGGFSLEQVMMISNGVDFDALFRSTAIDVRARFGIDQAALCLASVGSLIQRKRPLLAIEALSKNPSVHLIFIGGGELEEAARQHARDLGCFERVHFTGETSEVGSWLRGGIDAVVAPSSEEALPLGVIEALGIGLPIIGSDIGPHKELIGSFPDALLFATDNADDFAARIRDITKWPVDRLSAQSSRPQAVYARKAYSLEAYCNAFDALYCELTEDAKAQQ